MAAAINADTKLQGLGVGASSLAAVVTVTFPSVAPITAISGDTATGANFIGIATSATGSATETQTVATFTNGTTLGSAIAALGLTNIPAPFPLFIKARLATLTGGGAKITAALNAST
jgi:hypothetical protein